MRGVRVPAITSRVRCYGVKPGDDPDDPGRVATPSRRELPLPRHPRLADLDFGDRIRAYLVRIAFQDREVPLAGYCTSRRRNLRLCPSGFRAFVVVRAGRSRPAQGIPVPSNIANCSAGTGRLK